MEEYKNNQNYEKYERQTKLTQFFKPKERKNLNNEEKNKNIRKVKMFIQNIAASSENQGKLLDRRILEKLIQTDEGDIRCWLFMETNLRYKEKGGEILTNLNFNNKNLSININKKKGNGRIGTPIPTALLMKKKIRRD